MLTNAALQGGGTIHGTGLSSSTNGRHYYAFTSTSEMDLEMATGRGSNTTSTLATNTTNDDDSDDLPGRSNDGSIILEEASI
jgi:hypothetical protein